MQLMSTITAHTVSAATFGYTCWSGVSEILHRKEGTGLTEEAREHEELLKREKIRRDFHIETCVSDSSCNIQGTNYPSISAATIYMWPGLKEADKDAYNFLLLRQFYYLKQSCDAREIFYTCAIDVAVFALAFMADVNPWLTCGATVGTLFASTYFQRTFSFKAADAFAIRNASDDQLEGGLRYLYAIKRVRLFLAKKRGFIGKGVEIASEGNLMMVDTYTYLSKRIKNIKHEIAKRKKNNPFSDQRDVLNFNKKNPLALGNAIEKVIKDNLQGFESSSGWTIESNLLLLK